MLSLTPIVRDMEGCAVRADRLLSILLLLQARGRMRASELAAELEVSERTIYRDIDALTAAGVPVYGDPGVGGGYQLLDQFRTRLTGLTAAEARALFMLSIPEPLSRLGVDRDLRTALRKLSAEMPEDLRSDEARTRQRFHLDADWWQQHDQVVPHVQVLQHAVWDDRRLIVSYRPPFCEAIEQTVEPYGLVAKAGVWYAVLAAEGRLRVHRVSELIDVHDAGGVFARPRDFDLAAFWHDWCRTHEALLRRYLATVRVDPKALPELRRRFGARVLRSSLQRRPVGEDGRLDLELPFESFEAARERILGLGRGVEVIAPEALRLSVLDYAQQVVGLYSG